MNTEDKIGTIERHKSGGGGRDVQCIGSFKELIGKVSPRLPISLFHPLLSLS